MASSSEDFHKALQAKRRIAMLQRRGACIRGISDALSLASSPDFPNKSGEMVFLSLASSLLPQSAFSACIYNVKYSDEVHRRASVLRDLFPGQTLTLDSSNDDHVINTTLQDFLSQNPDQPKLLVYGDHFCPEVVARPGQSPAVDGEHISADSDRVLPFALARLFRENCLSTGEFANVSIVALCVSTPIEECVVAVPCEQHCGSGGCGDVTSFLRRWVKPAQGNGAEESTKDALKAYLQYLKGEVQRYGANDSESTHSKRSRIATVLRASMFESPSCVEERQEKQKEDEATSDMWVGAVEELEECQQELMDTAPLVAVTSTGVVFTHSTKKVADFNSMRRVSVEQGDEEDSAELELVGDAEDMDSSFAGSMCANRRGVKRGRTQLAGSATEEA